MKHWMSIYYTGTGWTYEGKQKKEKHSCFQKTLGLDLCRKTVDFFIEKAQAALEFLWWCRVAILFLLTLSQSYFLHLGSRLGPVWRINKVFPSLSVAHVLWVTECNNRPAKKGKGKKFFICGLWKSRYPLSAPKKCSFREFCNEKKAYVCSDRLSRRSKKARKLCWKV